MDAWMTNCPPEAHTRHVIMKREMRTGAKSRAEMPQVHVIAKHEQAKATWF